MAAAATIVDGILLCLVVLSNSRLDEVSPAALRFLPPLVRSFSWSVPVVRCLPDDPVIGRFLIEQFKSPLSRCAMSGLVDRRILEQNSLPAIGALNNS